MIGLLKKPRVLLLDDDPSMQRLITTLLRREGFRVDVVSEAREAIEKIGRFDYDVLLLDLMTPTEGGMTVMRHLREDNPPLLKRVVLVTASPASVLRAASKGVFAVVQKPFEAPELVATVRRLIG
jgi:two-component system response regulator GlrR